jgi:hypothetical protein
VIPDSGSAQTVQQVVLCTQKCQDGGCFELQDLAKGWTCAL